MTPASTLSIAQQELSCESDDDFGDFEDVQPELRAAGISRPALIERCALLNEHMTWLVVPQSRPRAKQYGYPNVKRTWDVPLRQGQCDNREGLQQSSACGWASHPRRSCREDGC